MTATEPAQLPFADREVIDGPNGVAYRWSGAANGLSAGCIINADVQLFVKAYIITSALNATRVTDLVDANGVVYARASQAG